MSESQRAGVQFSQPMRVFYAPLGNDGILPSAYSFASVSDDAVLLRADETGIGRQPVDCPVSTRAREKRTPACA